MKNNVICYYSNIKDYKFSDESLLLINSWKENWKQKGWNPIVLDEDYARSNNSLNEIDIDDFESNLYKFSKNNPSYLIQCYLRWFAYTKFIFENGDALWSDYDVYNHSLEYNIFESKYGRPSLHCGSGAVGLLNSDISKKWLNYLKEFYKHDSTNVTNTEFEEIFKSEDVNDMMIFKSFADSNPNVEWCPLSFNFNRDRSKVNVKIMNESWSLFHVHGGLRSRNNGNQFQSIDIPSECVTRSEIKSYVEKLLNSK